MTDMIAKKIARNVLKEHAGNQNGSADPYFEYVAATDMNGKITGKTVKRKRAVPPGLTKQEEKILKKVTRRAYRLDNAFNFCGIRVGWGSIVGFIPVLGDFFDTIMALMVLRTCMAAKITKSMQSKMMFNITLDFLIGLVPILGDFGDMLWRANTKNAALLYEHLEQRGAERIRNGQVPDGSRRPSPSPSRGDGVISQQPEMREMMPKKQDRQQSPIRQPLPVRTKTGDLLARYNPLASRTRDVDVENAEGGYNNPQRSGRNERSRSGRR